MVAHAPPMQVRVETLTRTGADAAPYRASAARRETLRIYVEIAPRGRSPYEVIVEVDECALQVTAPAAERGALGECRLEVGAIEALFVVERQPRVGFLTWFGVFARRRGRPDQLVIETPDQRVAWHVQHVIEQWIGLRRRPVRGELRRG
jgi:hypothetical protein